MPIMHFLSVIGTLEIISDGKYVTSIGISRSKSARHSDKITTRCSRELESYFQGKKQSFTIPIKAEGTLFQKKVWKAMSRIPYGKTMTYAGIAKKIGNPKAARAVGSACAKNPLLVVVPCHRVVGSSGRIGGFSAGISRKKHLLALEQKSGKQA